MLERERDAREMLERESERPRERDAERDGGCTALGKNRTTK